MQAEGREWLGLFSKESRDRFDYVFTDAMTWTNNNGKRMRLWIREETEVGDPQDFMDQLTDRIVKIVSEEPIDIHVNPTYLPPEIAGRYDELWTEERMDRVVAALAESGVALEINNRNRIPSPAFLKKAKEAGVKFTFGTNNAGADDLGRMDYCIEMIGELGLTSRDMWIPGK
jgi:histidinol phosphatase-like PHP family hydrolase